jgi:hypothetical protein
MALLEPVRGEGVKESVSRGVVGLSKLSNQTTHAYLGRREFTTLGLDRMRFHGSYNKDC